MAGGSSKSTTQQSTNTQDNRQVITETNTNYDLSNRSTNYTSSSYDLSNRSTSNLYDTSANNSHNTSNSNNVSNTTSNLYDTSTRNSNNTTTTNNYVTDQGAVSGGLALSRDAMDAVRAMGLSGYEYSDGIFSAALDFANSNDARMVNAFDKASSATGAALGQLQNAYADAKGTSDSFKQIMFAVLAVAAVGFVMMRR